MNKIPVWRTIGKAYGFAFGNLATIIGLIWLPLTVLLIGGYFAISHYFDGVLMAIARGNRYAAYSGAGYFYLYRIGTLLFEAVIAVSVMRQALGLREKGAFIHFRLGLSELRMFAAYVAYTLVIIAVEIAGAVVVFVAALGTGFAIAAIGPVQGIPAATLGLTAALVLVSAFTAALVFVTVRLSFFLVPITVAERRIDLIHGWEVTRGNFWRAFLIDLCVGLPTWLLYIGIQFALVGFAAWGEAPSLSPMAVGVSGPIEVAAARAHQILAWLPYLYGAWFVVQPLVLGLTSGAQAAAYRALVPEAPAVSTPPAGVPAAVG